MSRGGPPTETAPTCFYLWVSVLNNRTSPCTASRSGAAPRTLSGFASCQSTRSTASSDASALQDFRMGRVAMMRPPLGRCTRECRPHPGEPGPLPSPLKTANGPETLPRTSTSRVTSGRTLGPLPGPGSYPRTT